MPLALLSVSDKSGLVEFARGLTALGWELISTGGTARALRAAGLTVRDVSEVTGFPEMLDGRVKTLHPAVHGGLLARRDLPEHMAALGRTRHRAHRSRGREPVSRSARRRRRPGSAPSDVIENIDIGGPSHAALGGQELRVGVRGGRPRRLCAACSPRCRRGDDDLDLRRELAGKVYAHTAAYDAAIAAWFATRARASYSRSTWR